MIKEITIAVASSVLGALIAFLGSSALGLFDKTISDSQIQQVAKTLIDVETYRDVILDKMARSNQFKGEKGIQGNPGPPGIQGPPGRLSPKQGKEVIVFVKGGGDRNDALPHRVSCPEGTLVTGIEVQAHPELKLAVHQIGLICSGTAN